MNEKKVYLIFRDSVDDACEIRGYICGTASDADKYCEEYNKNCSYEWEEITWLELEKLN